MIWFALCFLLILVLIVLTSVVRDGELAEHLNLRVATTPEESNMIPVTLTETQKVVLSIAPTDRNGEPAPVEAIEWSTNAPGLVSLTVSEDGLSCTVQALGEVGQAEVEVVADADLGDGVVEIVETAFITIIDDVASSLNLTAGTPEFV